MFDNILERICPVCLYEFIRILAVRYLGYLDPQFDAGEFTQSLRHHVNCTKCGFLTGVISIKKEHYFLCISGTES